MTRSDLNTIRYALDNVRNREKEFCRMYIEQNPGDAERRTRDMELYLAALDAAWYEIKRQSNG